MSCRVSRWSIAAPFNRWGRGRKVSELKGVGGWRKRVLEYAVLLDEYGAFFDFRDLPAREFKALLAIVEGKNSEREKKQKKMKQKTNRRGR